MIKPENLRLGQVYSGPHNQTVEIIAFNLDRVEYIFNSQNINDSKREMQADSLCERLNVLNFALQVTEFKMGYLGKQEQPVQNPLKICRHTNIREDRFFSAMVYKTCKDCGKAIN